MTARKPLAGQECVVCRCGEVGTTDNPLAPEFRWIRKAPCDPCGGTHPICLACDRALGLAGEDKYEAAALCLDSDEIRVMLELQGRRS